MASEIKNDWIERFEKLFEPSTGDVGIHCEDCQEVVKDFISKEKEISYNEGKKSK